MKIRVRNFQDISICKILWLPDPKIFAEQNFSGEFFHQQLIRHALRGKDKYILKFLGSKHLLSIFQDIIFIGKIRFIKTVWNSVSHLTNLTPIELLDNKTAPFYFHGTNETCRWLTKPLFHEGCLRKLLTVDVSCIWVEDIANFLGGICVSKEYMKTLRESNPILYFEIIRKFNFDPKNINLFNLT